MPKTGFEPGSRVSRAVWSRTRIVPLSYQDSGRRALERTRRRRPGPTRAARQRALAVIEHPRCRRPTAAPIGPRGGARSLLSSDPVAATLAPAPSQPPGGARSLLLCACVPVAAALHGCAAGWHVWNLGTHDFRYDFTMFCIYMNSYMNS